MTQTLPTDSAYSASLPPLRVYLDDIERAVALLSSGGWAPALTAGGRTARTPRELAAAGGGPPTHLEIEGRHPEAGRVLVTFDPHYASITSRSADPRARAACDELRAMLERRRLPASRFTYGWLFPAIVAIFLVAVLFAGFRGPVMVLGLLLSLPLAAWSWYYAHSRHSTVVLRREADAPAPAWERQWERFAPFAATALIALVLGYAGRAMETRSAAHTTSATTAATSPRH